MPRPRFDRLSPEKRERILEAAAKSFAASGYENTSFNRILSEAGISKGAAYYYFDDKADLYVTTLRHYMGELLAAIDFDPARLTADNYWAEVAGLYRQQFTLYAQRPWVMGIARAAGAPLAMDGLAEGPLAEVWAAAMGLMAGLLQRGHELGMVRSDLPADLLRELLLAVDTAHDRWLLDRWATMAPEDLSAAAERIADTLRRLLSPA
jgi:AcrR family transcriptional regulator